MTLGPSGNLVKLSSSPGVIAMKRVPSVGVPEVGYLHKQALRFTEGQHPFGGADGTSSQEAPAAVSVLPLTLRAQDPQSRSAVVPVRLSAERFEEGGVSIN